MQCIKYLYSIRGKKFYTSVLSLAQFISTLQNKKVSKEKIVCYLQEIAVFDISKKVQAESRSMLA